MKRKRHIKRNLVIILIVLGLIGLTVSLTVGGSKQDEALAQASQTTTVQRGDLSLEITAAGNLALSRTEDLPIDLFYQEGTVEEVLVAEGDTVKEGQELVKLDTDEWNDELSTLEKAVATANRTLTSKESALTKAERAVTTAERTVTDKEKAVTEAQREITAKELAVSQAQVDVQTAEYNLSEINEVKKAQDDVDDAEYALKFAKGMLAGEFGGGVSIDYGYWSQLKANAEEQLDELQEDMQSILDGSSLTVSDDVALQVAKYQLLVKKSQLDLEDAQIAVDDAKQAVDDAQYALEDAKLAVKDAEQAVEDAKLDVADAKQNVAETQSDLDAAESLSPVITAPFDGFITKVNVAGGDEVMKGTVAVQIADPNKFEAQIMVSEMDISKVKLGGEALVKVDAMGLSLPATVTHIAPTATIQSGVVNYAVTVEVQPDATASSSLTASDSSAENAQLREGLTVTLSLIVADRQDVLLVPYASITTEGEQKYVQVVSQDGTTEKRTITTGITDYQFTEVTGGLSEGEQVLVSRGTTTAASTTTQQQPPSGMMMPMGMSGGPPSGGPPGG